MILIPAIRLNNIILQMGKKWAYSVNLDFLFKSSKNMQQSLNYTSLDANAFSTYQDLMLGF